jgi:hypothetical protein
MVAEMHFLEQVCKVFDYGLPTVNRSCFRQENRVLSEEHSQSRGIVFVEYLIIVLYERDKPLPQLWAVLQLCSHPVVGWQNARPGIFGLWSIQVATI